MIIMSVTEKEFNEFINKAQDEFKAFEKEVDDGLESIYKLLKAGVGTITTYLTNDFTTALRNQVTARIKAYYTGDDAIDNRNHATYLIDELYSATDRQISELRKKLSKTSKETSLRLSQNLSTLGIEKYFSNKIFHTLAMICPPYTNMKLNAESDLRERKNWNPIIEKLKAAGEIVG